MRNDTKCISDFNFVSHLFQSPAICLDTAKDIISTHSNPTICLSIVGNGKLIKPSETRIINQIIYEQEKDEGGRKVGGKPTIRLLLMACRLEMLAYQSCIIISPLMSREGH